MRSRGRYIKLQTANSDDYRQDMNKMSNRWRLEYYIQEKRREMLPFMPARGARLLEIGRGGDRPSDPLSVSKES